MLLAAAAAAVTPAPTVTAEQALANAKAIYSFTPPRRAPRPCPVASGNDIVVCREVVDPNEQRVPSDLDNGAPDDGGVPRAPNVSSLPDCSQGCIRVGKKPRQLHLIDLQAIPEPPPGSDADKMSKGEIPVP